MGYMRHHGIMITSFQKHSIEDAHNWAMEDFEGVAPVSHLESTECNGYWYFAVFPDGSKEGWAESERGDNAREKFTSIIGKP